MARDLRLAAVRRASVSLVMSGGVGLLVSLLLAPLTLGYLGADRYGVWMAAIGLTVVLEPVDFGVRNALLTAIARADASGDRRMAAGLVRASVELLVVSGLVVGAALTLALTRFSLDSLLGADTPDAQSIVVPTVAVLGLGLMVNLPLGVVDRVFLGLRQGARTGTMLLLGHGLSLVLVAGLALGRADVPVLAGGLIAGPILARLVVGYRLFRIERPELWLGTGGAGVRYRRSLLADSGFYFALQMAVAVGFATDQLVIARELGSAAVVDYSVPARAFAMVTAGAGFVARPLWPAFTEAGQHADWPWVRRTLRRIVLGVAAVSTLACVCLLALGPRTYEWLGRGANDATWALLSALAVWTVLQASGGALGSAMNGLDVRRPMLVAATSMAIANLALSLVLVRRMGVVGPLVASILTYVVFVVVPLWIQLPRVLTGSTAVESPQEGPAVHPMDLAPTRS